MVALSDARIAFEKEPTSKQKATTISFRPQLSFVDHLGNQNFVGCSVTLDSLLKDANVILGRSKPESPFLTRSLLGKCRLSLIIFEKVTIAELDPVCVRVKVLDRMQGRPEHLAHQGIIARSGFLSNKGS